MIREGYTWKEFTDAVTDMLTVDGTRLGLEAYRVAVIRQGVIDLQSYIPKYRTGQETIYRRSDVVMEGKASRGVKPPNSCIHDAYLTHIDYRNNAARFPVRGNFPWGDRFALVYGKVPLNDGHGVMAVEPSGYTFYVFPFIGDDWVLSVFWDGIKRDFKDDEEVPFDEPAVGAVAEFVKAKVAREADGNLSMHDSYRASYLSTRQRLFVDAIEEATVKSSGHGGEPAQEDVEAIARTTQGAAPTVTPEYYDFTDITTGLRMRLRVKDGQLSVTEVT